MLIMIKNSILFEHMFEHALFGRNQVFFVLVLVFTRATRRALLTARKKRMGTRMGSQDPDLVRSALVPVISHYSNVEPKGLKRLR